VELLLGESRTGELDGFRTRAGRPFKAALALLAGRIVFGGDDAIAVAGSPEPESTLGVATAPPQRERERDPQRSREGASRAKRKRSGQPPPGTTTSSGAGTPAPPMPPTRRPVICPCPVHAGCNVLETRGAYVCEQRLAAFAAGDPNPSGIMVPKVICGRPLTPSEAKALLVDGRTEELSGFVSKGGRSFRARLLRSETRGFVFDFPDRQPGEDQKERPIGGSRSGGGAKSTSRSRDRDDAGRHHKYPRRRASGRSRRPSAGKPEPSPP
jgi:hypothetical protein